MKKQHADFLVEKTKEDYDAIARDFNQSRSSLWGELKDFAAGVKKNGTVLDFGCGNGRLLQAFRGRGVRYVGTDQSRALIDAAIVNHKAAVESGVAQFLVSSGERLPFPDASFDAVFSVAVLHHIPSVEKRKALFAEFKRVLKPDGIVLVTVWNLWQKKYIPLIAKYTLKKIFGQSELDAKDILIPWRYDPGVSRAERYYHCFTKSELSALAHGADFREIECGSFGGEQKKFNLYILAKK